MAARNELAVRGMRVTKIAERKGLQMELTQQKVPLIEIMQHKGQSECLPGAGAADELCDRVGAAAWAAR